MLLLAGCGQSKPAGSPTPSPASTQGPTLNEWKPRIAVVTPLMAGGSAGKSVDQAYGVNVSVWPANKVLCTQPPGPAVGLYVTKNGEPGDLVALDPVLTKHEANGATFPSADFKDVNASLAADPGAKFSFVAYARGLPASNVYLHTGDKPAEGGQPVKPSGYSSPNPAAVDTRIQVVFPHDDQGHQAPVKSATAVNIAVDIFQHGTMLSVAPDAKYDPRLWLAEGSDVLQMAPPGVQRTTYTVNGQGYPRWIFNDVRVEPDHSYHFLATTAPLGQPGGSYPNIWNYVGEIRSPFKPQPPPSCIP
jgi:hypothetical protein